MYFQSVNGKQVQQISTNDRGLAYGDGVFTTAIIENGSVKLLHHHIERLINGTQTLGIKFEDHLSLKNEMMDIASEYERAVIKVMITAGEGGRGYSRFGVGSPNIIIKVSEFPEKYIQWQSKGISVTDAVFKLGLNPSLAGIKHLNRLEQVLLRNELDDTPHDDLLVYDLNNMLVETTCANLFWIENKQLYTPEILNSGVAGLIRAEIIKQFPHINIVSTNKERINNADGMFITNSIMGIMPIKQYNDTIFDIQYVREFMKSFEY